MRALILVAICGVLSPAASDGQCDTIRPIETFDCFPENNPSEEKCLARGCCWRAPPSSRASHDLDASSLKSPSCFYGKNFRGYSVVNKTTTNTGLRVFLERVKPSGVEEDIKLLRVDVIYQTDEIARIRIVDPSTQRWEPPLPKPPAPKTIVTHRYLVEMSDNSKLHVSRLGDSTGPAVPIVSFDLASMVYTDRFIQVSSKLPSSVIYGLGEHKGSLRRSVNFTRWTFYNEDRAPSYDARLYGTHPFYVNVERDGRANGVWLFNSNAMDVILQPTPAITYRPVGGILDFFVFVGPTPAKVVQQYQEIVGKPKMIPYWSLGFHLCRFGYTSTEDTRSTMQNNLDAGVRVDVLWNDIDYMNDRNDFTLDPVNYKDLGSWVEQLHRDGRRYVMIIDPAVSGSEPVGSYPPFDRGLELDVFVKDTNGKVVHGKVWNRKTSVFPDFTHPNATPYWTEMFSDFYKQVPFDGAWIDMNEPSNLVDGHVNEGCPDDSDIVYTPGGETLHKNTLCNTDRHHWSSHYDVHNMYGFTEAVATYNALATVRPNKRPFIISRSSFSGHGFYAGHWTGDVFSTWTDLKDSVPGFLEFSLYGIPMVGVDICGFHGNATMDLCARWQALGAFYPFSRNHNEIDTRLQDPASMGGNVLQVTKNAYYWRYKLLPYLYTLFYKAHVSGETVARPLFFEYPKDANTYDNDEQFMWGDALMVVPALYENQREIHAYFPKGIWYDVQNRTSTAVDASSGGKFVTLPADEDIIHFFMKGGKCVFYQEPGETTADSRQNPYGLYVFLDEKMSSSGSVYIDDGESIDAIDTGHFTIAEVAANDSCILLQTVGSTSIEQRLDQVQIYGISKKPTKISGNGKTYRDFCYDEVRQLVTIFNVNEILKSIVISIFYD